MLPRSLLGSAALAALGTALLTAPSPAHAADGLDAPRYELDVRVGARGLTVHGALTWRGGTPAELRFDLVPQMRVTAVDLEGGDLEYAAGAEGLVVTVTKPPDGRARRRLTFTLEGSPRERFGRSRGGYVRSAVEPDIAYVRSQVAWYPRLGEQPATYRVSLNVPEDWTALTAGTRSAEAAREVDDIDEVDEGRAVWTYSSERPLRRIGLVAGPFRRVTRPSGGGFAVDALVTDAGEQAAQHLLDVAARSHAHYRARFGEPAPERFILVEMPAAFGRGSGYGESGYLLIGRGAFEAAGDAPWADALVAHEMAHTWFGGTAPFADFSSEALASYATLGFVAADKGPDAARLLRREAVEAVVAVSRAGDAIDLPRIEGFGGGLDPRTYRVHAYDKGMLVLSMLADRIGRDALDARIAGLLRGEPQPLHWSDLRRAASSGSDGEDPDVSAFLSAWERAGVPELALDHAVREEGGAYVLTGRVTVTDGDPPRPVRVEVGTRVGGVWHVGDCDPGTGGGVELRLGSAPTVVVVDPEFRVLAARPAAGPDDPGFVLKRAFAAVNSPDVAADATLRETIAALRELLGARATPHEGLCHTGIGRCLFRLGEHGAAERELLKALDLGPGGPFHARWAHLRLGCIADLRGERDAALEHYRRAARGRGAAPDRARRFIERTYRGFAEDG